MIRTLLSSVPCLALVAACGSPAASPQGDDGGPEDNPGEVTGGDSFTCQGAVGYRNGEKDPSCRGDEAIDCDEFCHPTNPDECLPREAFLDLCGEDAEDEAVGGGPGGGDNGGNNGGGGKDDTIITCDPDGPGCVGVDPDDTDDVDENGDGDPTNDDVISACNLGTCAELGVDDPATPEDESNLGTCLAQLAAQGVPYQEGQCEANRSLGTCVEQDGRMVCERSETFNPEDCRDCLAVVRVTAVSDTGATLGSCPTSAALAIATMNGKSFRSDFGDGGNESFADTFFDQEGGTYTASGGSNSDYGQIWESYASSANPDNWETGMGAMTDCPLDRTAVLTGMSDPEWTGDDEWHEGICADLCDSLPGAVDGALGGLQPEVADEWVYLSETAGGDYTLYETEDVKTEWDMRYDALQEAVETLDLPTTCGTDLQEGVSCCPTSCKDEQLTLVEEHAGAMAEWFVHPDQGVDDEMPAIPMPPASASRAPLYLERVGDNPQGEKNWEDLAMSIADCELGEFQTIEDAPGGFSLEYGTALLLAAPSESEECGAIAPSVGAAAEEAGTTRHKSE